MCTDEYDALFLDILAIQTSIDWHTHTQPIDLAALTYCVPNQYNCQRRDSPPTATQPNAGSGKEIPEGGRERARGEVASFWNSESRALSQQDFGFGLCAAPKFQV